MIRLGHAQDAMKPAMDETRKSALDSGDVNAKSFAWSWKPNPN